MPLPYLLTQLELPNFKEISQEKITYLCDLVTQEIPSDPVVVHYKNDALRIFSEDTLNHLINNTQKDWAILKEYARDKSTISLAIEELSNNLEDNLSFITDLLPNEEEKPSDEETRKLIRLIVEFFKELTGLNAYQIVDRIDSPEFRQQLYNIFVQISLGNAVDVNNLYLYFDIFLMTTSIGKHGFNSIVLFEELQFFQTTLFLNAQGRLKKEYNGNYLHEENEIKCPSREIINLNRVKKKGATEFLSIIIYLTKLAQVENGDINDFLDQQDTYYLMHAEKTLINYLNNAEEFNFSEAQHNFLNTLGLSEIKSQIDKFYNKPALEKKYQHLWNHSDTLKENVIKLFGDYSKLDSKEPNYLKRFATGHWNRHHDTLVTSALEKIANTQNEDEILIHLLTLEEDAKKAKDFNESGSLARRFSFLKHTLTNKSKTPEISPTKSKTEKLTFLQNVSFLFGQDELEKKYNHLWDSTLTLKKNVSKLLGDYIKSDNCSPNYFKLFFTGHWNRHHHGLITDALKKIRPAKTDDEIFSILINIETQVKNTKNMNEFGSLARRIDFMKYKMKDTPIEENNDFHLR